MSEDDIIKEINKINAESLAKIDAELDKYINIALDKKYNKLINHLYNITNNAIFKEHHKRVIIYKKKSKNKDPSSL